jgi:para-nitrobenzyl esterase
MAVEFARAMGVEGDGEAALSSLRALPAEKVVEGSEPEKVISAIFGGPQVLGVANAIIDGRLIVETPEAALRAGRQAMVPLITGANDASSAQNKDELFALFGPLASQGRSLYDPKGDASLEQLIQTIIADRTMIEPSRNLADLMTKAGQPAYFYRFSYVPEAQRGKVPGATHGSEILFAFDGVAAGLKDKASVADLAMGKTMSGYWVAFVKTGDPNGDDRPEWPRYDPVTCNVLDFTNTQA